MIASNPLHRAVAGTLESIALDDIAKPAMGPESNWKTRPTVFKPIQAAIVALNGRVSKVKGADQVPYLDASQELKELALYLYGDVRQGRGLAAL